MVAKMKIRKYNCKEKDCNNEICYETWKYGKGRCSSCASKGKRNFNYIDGRTNRQYYCIDCCKEISCQSMRCQSCETKRKYKLGIINSQGMFGKHHTTKTREKLSKANKGKHNSPKTEFQRNRHVSQKTEFKKNQHFSIKTEFKKGHKWDKNIELKRIRNSLKGNQRKTKPEKYLEKILNLIIFNQYKYVGDGKIFIARFVPDFINCNGQKKIIEMYGDYWHNRPEVKKRDKCRIKTYAKYGYKTLIIWEHELKNIEMVIAKLLEFEL